MTRIGAEIEPKATGLLPLLSACGTVWKRKRVLKPFQIAGESMMNKYRENITH